jgi:hypothetical protein
LSFQLKKFFDILEEVIEKREDNSRDVFELAVISRQSAMTTDQ